MIRKNGAPKSKKAAVYDTLKKRIIENVLKPGEPLNEIVLSKDLKTSKTPVREALQQLEKEGFVENLPGRGSFVSRFSLQDIRDLFEMRELIECAVIRGVASKPDVDVEKARQICDRFKSESTNDTRKNHINAGDQIHTFFFEAFGNKKLLNHYRALQEQIIRVRRALLEQVDTDRAEASYREHLEAIEAVIARDPERAEAAMKNHLINSVSYIKGII